MAMVKDYGVLSHQFDDESKSMSMEWKILMISNFRASPVASIYCSEYVEGKQGAKWQLRVYPNGQNEGNEGQCMLFLKLRSMPEECAKMIVCYNLRCIETGSSYQGIETYDKSVGKGWLNGTQSLADLDGVKSLSYHCHFRILQIIDTAEKVIYRYPFDPKAMAKKQTFQWTIDEALTQRVLAAPPKKQFYSPMTVSRDGAWSVSLSPNGNNADTLGTVCVFLELCALPTAVEGVKVKYTLTLSAVSAVEEEVNGEYTFIYESTTTGHPMCTLDALQAAKGESFVVCAKVEVIEFYSERQLQALKANKPITKYDFGAVESHFDDDANVMTVEWTIDDAETPKLRAAPVGSRFFSASFEGKHGAKWQMRVDPNGLNKKTKRQSLLFLKLLAMPKEYAKMMVYYNMRCVETGSSYQAIKTYAKPTGWGWINGTQPLPDLDGLPSLSYHCSFRVLKIIDEAEETVFCHPFDPKTMAQEQSFEWKLDEALTERVRTASPQKGFHSPSNLSRNGAWSLEIRPNGKNAGSVGKVFVFVKLCALPIGAVASRIRVKLVIPEIEAEKTFTHTFSYGSSPCSKLMGKFEKLQTAKTLSIKASVTVLELHSDLSGTVFDPHAPDEVDDAKDEETEIVFSESEDGLGGWTKQKMQTGSFNEKTRSAQVHIAIERIADAVASTVTAVGNDGDTVPIAVVDGIKNAVVNASWGAADPTARIVTTEFDDDRIFHFEMTKTETSNSTGTCCWKKDWWRIDANWKVMTTAALSTKAKLRLENIQSQSEMSDDMSEVVAALGVDDEE